MIPSKSSRNKARSGRPSPYFIRRLSSWLILSTALTLGAAKVAHAQTSSADTWLGNSSALFNGSNWTGGNNPPLSGDSLFFGPAGTAGSVLTDNWLMPGSYNIAGLTFNVGAAAYTINPSGANNGFTLTGGVTNNSTNTQTINDLIFVTAVQTFTTTAGGGNITLGGVVSGPSGGITTAGGGTLTLGATGNNYAGATTVGTGTTLALTGTLTGGTAITTAGSGILSESNTGGISGASTITLAGTGTSVLGGVNSYTGATTIGAGTTLSLTGSLTGGTAITTAGTGSLSETGTGSISGASSITLVGTGTSVLGGTNTYVGVTTIGTGTTLSLTGSLTGGTAITTAGSGILSETNAGSISGASSITLAGTGTSALGGANTYAGVTSIGTGTTLSLTGTLSGTAITATGTLAESNTGAINGASTLTVTAGTSTLGGANAYTGATTISGGTLSLTGSLTGGTAITTAGTAALSETNTGSISGASSITLVGTGTSTLAGANSYTGATTIGTGTNLTLTGTLTGGTAITTAGTGILSENAASGSISGASSITLVGSGASVLDGANTYTGATLIGTGTTLTIGTAVLAGSVSGTAITVNGTLTELAAGTINGGTSITVTGGTANLAGVNTYTGGTTINAGTVTLTISGSALGANGVTLGATSGSSAASLVVGTTGLTVANPITLATGNTGALLVGNTGATIATTFSGGVTGTNNLIISNNATGVSAVTFSTQPINNAGTITVTGAGTGATTISGGVGPLVTAINETSVTSPVLISTTALTVASGGTTLTNGAASGTLATFTVSGGIGGTGNLVLANNNSSITNGLQLTGSAVNNTGTITNQGAGTSAVLISAPVGSAVTAIVQKSASSALTLSSTTSAFAGPITINAGTVTLSGSIGGSALTLGGGTFSFTNAATPQILGAVAVTPGLSTVDAGTGATLTLGTITQSPASFLNFNNGTTGTVKIANGVDGTGMIGTWASFSAGPTLAYVQGGGGNAVAAYTGATPDAGNLATVANPGVNYSYALAATLAGSQTGNTLKYTGTATTTALGANSLTLNGLMNAGTGLLTISGTAANPGLVIGANGELDILSNTLGITISSVISGTGAVVYGGPSAGVLTLSGIDTYNGALTVNSGTVTISGTQAASAININAGTVNAGNVGALGSGMITLGNGVNPATLNATVAGTFANAIVLANGNVGALTISNGTGSGITDTFSGGVTGTGNLNLVDGGGGASVLAFSTNAINNAGTVTYSGTGTGTSTISAIGSNVTGVNLTSSSSALTIGTLVVNSAGTTLTNTGGLVGLTVNGGITGTGNLILNTNATTGGITLSVASVNNSGTITISGTAAGSTNISGGVGSNVTAITDATTAITTISGPLTVNASGTTLNNNNSATFTVSGGSTGTGNLIFNANSTGVFTVATAALNNTGTITNSGTGTATTTISSGVGSSVTTINQASNTSALTDSGTLAVNSGGTTINSTGTAATTVSGAVSGTGNLVLNANSAGTITIGAGAVGNTGTITNSGTGTGLVTISGIIGTTVTVFVQNSATSPVSLAAANTFTGGLAIKSGTVTAHVASALGAATNVVTLGSIGGTAPATLLTDVNSLTFANPIVLASGDTGTLTIGINTPTVGVVFTGGVTGTNNLTINNTTLGGTGDVSFTTNPINNAGTVTVIGVQGNNTPSLITGGVGANVTGLIVNSTSTGLNLTTTALTVNSSGTTLTNLTGTALLTVGGGVGGTGNLILNNNSATASGVTLATIAVNNAGTITNSGTGTGASLISITIGTGTSGAVTQVIENSATSQLNATGGLDVAAGGTTLTNSNASGSQLLNLSGAVSGTGNLIINNNSAIGTPITTIGGATGGITLGAVNNIGALTNSSTGTGPVYITGSIGAAVTAINQNSTTSPLVITGGTAGATTGTVTIANGATVQLGNQSANNLALGVGTIATSTSGTLIFAPGTTNTLNYANVLTGSGTVILNGLASALPAGINLTGITSTFNGTYTINQGRIGITASTNLGAPTSILINGNSNNFTGGQLFINTAAFTQSTPITINGYGPTEALGNMGAIRLAFSGDIYSGPITLGSNASIDAFNSATTLSSATVSGVISGGSGAQLMIGTPINGTGLGNNPGTLTLSNTNTFSGGTIISGETAALTAAGALGTGSVTVGTNVTQYLSGLTESVANALTGTNSLTINGGNATLSVANNYSGGTALNGAYSQAVGTTAAGGNTITMASPSGLFVGETVTGVGLPAGELITAISGNVVTITTGTGVTSGTNTLNFTSGILTVSAANALGTGALTVTNGTFNANVAATLNPTFQPVLNQTGGAVVTTTANAFQGAVTLNLTGGTTSLGAAQSYTGGANISGSNVTTISAANALSGTTTVSGGGTLSSNLAATTAGIVNLSGGTIAVNSGGILTSAAAGGSFWNVTVNSGGIVNPGGVGVIGTAPLTLNALSTVSGGILQFDTATGNSSDQIAVGTLPSGSYSFGAGTIISPMSFGQLSTIDGVYSLINYGAGTAPTLGAGGLITSTAPSGINYGLTESSGNVVLTISGAYNAINSTNGAWLPTVTPGGGTATSWNVAANWFGGVVPKLAGDTANFNSALLGPQAVTVDGQQHVGTLTLNPSTAFAYTINQGTAGSMIYLDNGASSAQINNSAQNNVINAPINLLSANTNVNVAPSTNLTLGNISGTGKLTLTGGAGSVTLPNTVFGTWTGGTEVDSGTLILPGTYPTNVTSLNNGGLGIVTLNGGTVSFTNATGTTASPATGFVLNIVGSGGTLNLAAGTSGTGGKLNLQGFGFLTGSGQFTKTGGGDLQDGGPSIAFTGNVVLSNNGLIEDQSSAALGFGTGTGFGGGSVTLNGPSGTNAPELVASGVQIFNPITLAGGTLSANSSNIGIFNSTVTVTAASTLRASQFQGQTIAQNFAINTLAGSANLAVNGSTTSGAIGLVTLGNASGYTGAITLGANAALGIGSGSFFGAGATIANFTNVTSGIGLVADGDGTSTPQTIAYVLPSQVTAATFGSGNTTGYIVGHQGATTLFNQAANKTISLAAALPYNNTNTLNVQPFNGYGLLLTAQPALLATTTFGVGTVVDLGSVGGANTAPTAQASNVIAGLELINLTGGFGITKTGVGTLQLGASASDTSNTFGVAGAAGITVSAGLVSAFADQNLGVAGNNTTGNGITLNGGGFLALGTQAAPYGATNVLFTLTGAGTIGVANTGNTLTLNKALAFPTATIALTKTENGTLVPTLAATGANVATGSTTINAGAIAITASSQLGGGTITVGNFTGATLQISGGGTFTQALALNNYGIQGNGALEVTSGSPTWNTGVINMAGAGTIGVDSSLSTLTIGSSITTTAAVGFVGAGNIIINTALTGGSSVSEYGTGTTTFNATGVTYGALSADIGNIVLAGTSTAGIGASSANYGGSLTVSDATTNQANRLVAHSFSSVGGGSFTLVGNSSAVSTEGFLTFAPNRGQTTVTVTPGTNEPVNLTLTASSGSLARVAFSTATFVSNGTPLISGTGTAGTTSASINTGVAETAANFQGAGTVQTGTANLGILPWALVNNNGTVTLATASIIGASGYLRNLGAGETTASFQNYLNANAASATNTLATTAVGTTLVTNNNIASSLYVGESVSTVNPVISGTTVAASATITVPYTSGILVGQQVTGTGIPASEFVTAVNPANNTITITTGTGVTAGTNSLTYASLSAGDYITNISGTTITLATAGVAAVSNVPITFGTTGTNITLASGSNNGPGGTTGQAGALTQTINSLTLNTGANLTLPNSNTVVTIANTALGGAILALDATGNTISGGQITGGTTGDLIIHTVGNLTINSAIIGGATGAGNGLTKGDAGTLTIGGTAFYNGQTVVNAGTLNLNNGNNTIQFANYLTLAAGSTLQLNGNSQIFTDLLSDNATVAGLGIVGGNSTITGISGATVVVKGDGTSRGFTGTITGPVGLLRANASGTSATWTLSQNSNYTGPTYIAGGTIDLVNSGAFSGTTSLTIAGGLTLDNTGSMDSSSRLSSSLPITMSNGALTYLGHAQYASAESLGVITGTLGTNTITVTPGGTAVNSATLTLAGLTRNTGSTVNFAGTTLGTIGSNPQILVTGGIAGGNIVSAGTAITSLTGSIIGGGFTVGGTDFASYNPTYGVGALGTVGFAGYSPLLINNAASTDNVSMATGTGVNIMNTAQTALTQTVNSLRVTGTTPIGFGLNGANSSNDTLILTTGGLLASGNLTLGASVNNGALTSGTNELFLLGGGTSTINSAITGAGVAVVRTGGVYSLAGTNTYTGGTYLDGGTTTLLNSGNVTTGLSTLGTGGIFVSSGTFTQTAGGKIPAQALTIEGSAVGGTSAVNLASSLALASSVTTFGSNTITVASTNGIAVGQLVSGAGIIPGNEFVTAVNPATNTVTITSGVGVTQGVTTVTFLVNNTLNALTFNNTGGQNSPILTIGGLLNLPNGVITASSSNPGSTSTVTGGNLDLGNFTSPTITVNPIVFNGQNIAPLQPTLIVNSVLQDANNALSVTGGGNLQLGGASTFTGGVTLAGSATPSLATNLTIGANSTNAANGQPLTGPLGTGTFTIGQNSTLYSTGAFTVGNNVVVNGNFTFDAPTSAAASLTLGAGSQTIALPASTATTVP